MEHDLTKLARELFESTEPQKDTTETPKPILLESILPSLPPEGRLGSMASIRFAGGRSSMICASSARSYSCSIGSVSAIHCKNSNATSAHPIIGSSLPGQRLLPHPHSRQSSRSPRTRRGGLR
jgi:hypothetical protein